MVKRPGLSFASPVDKIVSEETQCQKDSLNPIWEGRVGPIVRNELDDDQADAAREQNDPPFKHLRTHTRETRQEFQRIVGDRTLIDDPFSYPVITQCNYNYGYHYQQHNRCEKDEVLQIFHVNFFTLQSRQLLACKCFRNFPEFSVFRIHLTTSSLDSHLQTIIRLTMLDEKDLVQKILDGDMRSFDTFVKRYENLVYHVVYRLVSEKQDAEDISQDVFIKIFRNIKQFRFQSKLSTWVARIAYLTAINYLKKYRRITVTAHPEQIEDLHVTEDGPEEKMQQKDSAAYISRLIEKMPIPYRTVITLYHMDEFSYREIQEITGISEGMVKINLFRARKWLKEKLGEYQKKQNP